MGRRATPMRARVRVWRRGLLPRKQHGEDEKRLGVSVKEPHERRGTQRESDVQNQQQCQGQQCTRYGCSYREGGANIQDWTPFDGIQVNLYGLLDDCKRGKPARANAICRVEDIRSRSAFKKLYE